ncbi:MAG: hypothetical protein ACK46Q_10040 [Hyphomonas sp.]
MKVRFVQIFTIACVVLVLPACSRQNSPVDFEGVSALFAECYSDELAPISLAVYEYLDADGALMSGAKSVSELRAEVVAVMTNAYDDAAICLGGVAPMERDCPALAMCFQAFADQNL